MKSLSFKVLYKRKTGSTDSTRAHAGDRNPTQAIATTAPDAPQAPQASRPTSIYRCPHPC